jgi:hypothetical protein
VEDGRVPMPRNNRGPGNTAGVIRDAVVLGDQGLGAALVADGKHASPPPRSTLDGAGEAVQTLFRGPDPATAE